MKRLLAWASCALLLLATNAMARDVEYRLPSGIQPTFQKIHLNIDPDTPEYSGVTIIDIDITKPTQRVGFYQLDLQVDSAELVQNQRITPLAIEKGDYDVMRPARYPLVLIP